MKKRSGPPSAKYAITVCLVVLSCSSQNTDDSHPQKIIHEVNETEIEKGTQLIALVGATLIDGNGGQAIQNSCVVVRGNTIEAVGKSGDVAIPAGADIIDVSGLHLVPGLIDAHYHNEESIEMAPLFLQHGVTSVRDPGAWIEAYAAVRDSHQRIPRLFLTGPHLDAYPPAYPRDSYLVQDATEGSLAVEKLIKGGATAIKVYYRLPVATIKAVCETAHRHGLPVTAHLEITNAKDAIEAGLDGIEHITSLGTALLPPRDAEKYRQQVLADNNARKRGRYEMWNSLALNNNPRVDSLVQLLSRKHIFISPTLAIFESRPDTGDSIEVQGFRNMVRFAGMLKDRGVQLVVGSHTWVPYAADGLAYAREMELLQEAGLLPMEVLQAATIENARFFRVDERLGSIVPGKIADIVLVDGDPLTDIKAMRNVKRVMLNGVWVSMEK